MAGLDLGRGLARAPRHPATDTAFDLVSGVRRLLASDSQPGRDRRCDASLARRAVALRGATSPVTRQAVV